ncbi:D-tyrosyl-tRNA deacylase [Auriscalpium vulgare]|uniref:D-tyrosyl-tRNA deacylase n=1 Tax=Auriscalpium vulgare TaxID=40419 RepID=A0ACB8SCJ5_9AGAM|nr:D-tyrosyl-tRNA deacylase [Auriscalpium vulgare]
MKAVVQRVLTASVSGTVLFLASGWPADIAHDHLAVDNEVVSQISRGLMVLVGIGSDDTTSDIDVLTKKILSLRLFPDNSDSMWKASVKDVHGEILCVSQFTLMANTSKGNKPDFHRAMSSDQSRTMYAWFLEKLGQAYDPTKIKDGKFGAMMNVTLTNEGPVTLTLDSRKFVYTDQKTAKVGEPTSSAS